jgi:hypothetical protein
MVTKTALEWFQPITKKIKVSPGQTTICQYWLRLPIQLRAKLNTWPQSAYPVGVPIPRKLKAAKLRTTSPTARDASTMVGKIAFGRI